MKILFFILIILITYNIAYSDCGVPLNNCSNIFYPYQCCDGNTRCLKDPINNNPKALKATGKICLSFDPNNNGPTEVDLPSWFMDQSCPNYNPSPIYYSNSVQNDIDCAENNNWACICGTQNYACICTIPVLYSDAGDYTHFPHNSDGTSSVTGKTIGLQYEVNLCKNGL